MTNKKTILIVDDEQDERTYLSTLLGDNGYNVITAENGDEALKKVKEVAPALITLDVTMPEKSGVKFYREMRESDDWKNIPIIIITGVTEEFKKFISSRRQVPPPDGYLSKPIDQSEFLKIVKKLV